jgi:predicted CopG family antitoxin
VFVYGLCMSKTITIEDDVYNLLASLKQDRRDSFTRVIRRHIPRPLETAGELLDAYERAPAPKIDWKVLDKIAGGRGRRSGGRK